MKNMTKISIYLSLLISLFLTQAQALPKAFSASYAVNKSGMMIGVMQSQLSYQNGQYLYHKNTQAEGLAAILSGDQIIETSEGDVRGNQLVVKNYDFHHKSKRKNKKERFIFETATTVKGDYNGNTYQLNVPTNASDMALLEILLMQDFQTGKPATNYSVVKKGQLKQYAVSKQGTEALEINAKNYSCEKVKITNKNGRQTTLWLAKELGYLPVRIQQNNNGKSIDAKMTSHSFK